MAIAQKQAPLRLGKTMNRLAALFGLAVIGFAPGAGAQTLLSNLSLAESATATTTSSDYRYTKHTSGGSGRGGGYRSHTFYTWDPYLDQTTILSLPMFLNGSSGNTTSAGTFYAKTYSATASATTTLSNTATKSVFALTCNASTTLNTPQVAHQNVTVTAQPGGTFSFTLTDYTDVKVTATGSANGVFRLFTSGSGVIMGPLYGAGTLISDSTLPPGDYWITNSLVHSAAQNTQINTLLNPGTSSDSYSFTVTFTQVSADGSGGGGGD